MRNDWDLMDQCSTGFISVRGGVKPYVRGAFDLTSASTATNNRVRTNKSMKFLFRCRMMLGDGRRCISNLTSLWRMVDG